MTIKTHPSNQDDDILKDGQVLRVKMLAMDSVMDSSTVVLSDGKPAGLHKPGFRYTATDAAAVTRRQMASDEYQHDITTRWQSPAPDPITTVVEDSALLDDQFDDEGGDFYAAYDRAIQERWRSK